MIGENIFTAKKREYLGEVRIRKGENIAIFPCEVFHRKTKRKEEVAKAIDDFKFDYWRYCFDYVTTSIKGSTNTTTSFCMPAKLKGKNYFSFIILHITFHIKRLFISTYFQ